MDNMVHTDPYKAMNNSIEKDPATSEASATNYFKSGNTGKRIQSSYTGTSGLSSVCAFAAYAANRTVPPVLEKLKSANQYNPKDLTISTNEARYFVMKRYSGDDIHRSIKYSIWCSTEHGNKILDAAFKEREGKGPVYLLFSVTGSGHFCGVAQMMSMVDYSQSAGVWIQDKWKGQIEVKWIYVKDVPNSELRHICLENNENKPVTNSRDTQEVPPEKGKQVLKIVHNYKHSSSIFDDFGHYEKRQEEDGPPPRPKSRNIPGTKLNKVSDRLQNNFHISENCFRMYKPMPTDHYSAIKDCIEKEPATSKGSLTNYSNSLNKGNHYPSQSLYTGQPGPSSVRALAADAANRTVPPVLAKLISANQYNPKDFTISTNEARYFVMKRYLGDDIHRSIKYSIWCSTEHGNKKLDAAFKEGKGPVYLLYTVTGSGCFCGVAQMMSMVDYSQSAGVWTSDKWKGHIEVKWIYVKDVPNSQLRHLRLENNENKPVTHSKDTQEVPPEKGNQLLEIVHNYKHSTSIFDDFEYYEKRQAQDQGPPPRPKSGFRPKAVKSSVKMQKIYNPSFSYPHNTGNGEGARPNGGDTSVFSAVGVYDFNEMFNGFGYPPMIEYQKPSEFGGQIATANGNGRKEDRDYTTENYFRMNNAVPTDPFTELNDDMERDHAIAGMEQGLKGMNIGMDNQVERSATKTLQHASMEPSTGSVSHTGSSQAPEETLSWTAIANQPASSQPQKPRSISGAHVNPTKQNFDIGIWDRNKISACSGDDRKQLKKLRTWSAPRSKRSASSYSNSGNTGNNIQPLTLSTGNVDQDTQDRPKLVEKEAGSAVEVCEDQEDRKSDKLNMIKISTK